MTKFMEEKGLNFENTYCLRYLWFVEVMVQQNLFVKYQSVLFLKMIFSLVLLPSKDQHHGLNVSILHLYSWLCAKVSD